MDRPDSGRQPWNKGKLVGQKAPLKVRDIRGRDLALLDLGVDSKLRACEPCQASRRGCLPGNCVPSRAIVMQQKTRRPVQFEISASTREAVDAWIKFARLRTDDYLFPSRLRLRISVPGNSRPADMPKAVFR